MNKATAFRQALQGHWNRRHPADSKVRTTSVMAGAQLRVWIRRGTSRKYPPCLYSSSPRLGEQFGRSLGFCHTGGCVPQPFFPVLKFSWSLTPVRLGPWVLGLWETLCGLLEGAGEAGVEGCTEVTISRGLVALVFPSIGGERTPGWTSRGTCLLCSTYG